jgi:hypothetical protein
LRYRFDAADAGRRRAASADFSAGGRTKGKHDAYNGDTSIETVVTPLLAVIGPCIKQKRAMKIFLARIGKTWPAPVFTAESR